MREKIYTVREGKKCLSHDIVALSCDICALSHDICEFILYHHNYAYVDDIGHAIGDRCIGHIAQVVYMAY